MTMHTTSTNDLDLARAWIELQHISIETPNYDSLASAAVTLNNLCLTEEERAWRVVVSVFEASKDEWVIENLGAGPVESLLDFHPATTIQNITRYVKERPDFKGVLKHVWTSRLPEEHKQALSKVMR